MFFLKPISSYKSTVVELTYFRKLISLYAIIGFIYKFRLLLLVSLLNMKSHKVRNNELIMF